MSERAPVQSTRMSPGSSIDMACSAVTSPAMRSTVPDARDSIKSLSERSMVLSGTNPWVHSRSAARRSPAIVRR